MTWLLVELLYPAAAMQQQPADSQAEGMLKTRAAASLFGQVTSGHAYKMHISSHTKRHWAVCHESLLAGDHCSFRGTTLMCVVCRWTSGTVAHQKPKAVEQLTSFPQRFILQSSACLGRAAATKAENGFEPLTAPTTGKKQLAARSCTKATPGSWHTIWLPIGSSCCR